VAAKRLDLRIDLRIVPVRPAHRRFQVVGVEDLRNPAKMAEGVLQSPDEVFGVLVQNRFAVGLARTAQDDAKDPASLRAAVFLTDRCAQAEVDLGFFAGLALDARSPFRQAPPHLAYEALYRFVRAGEPVFDNQILKDALAL